PPHAQYLVHKSLAASHVAASYWTAASDLAATSAPVNAVGHRSTAVDHGGPPVTGGWWAGQSWVWASVETPLFATMLVHPQDATEEQDEEDEVSVAPKLPSPTHELTPPSLETITSHPQAQPVPLSSPPQEQPTTNSTSDMTLLNTL
nr:hypothetical protein [Tanacetum cinerariifolium]